MRAAFAVALSSALLLAPRPASAQEEEPGCPPGGWFCEETPPPEPEPAVAGEQGPEPGPSPYERHRRPLEIDERVAVATPPPPPPKKRRRWSRKWGLNLHLEGALMGGSRQRDPDSGMAGLGFSFRYRPIPHFALDTGLDFLGGVDWQGYDRSETALLVNAMVYFNPKNSVQFYMLGGIGFSGATVRDRDTSGYAISGTERHYSYFGGQLGLGLEFRLTHRISLNLDVVGFVRGRTDDKARYTPEFTDPETGRTTNSSGGGLMRGGISFYW